MIEYRDGDLLEQTDLTHIVHQANLFCTFGAGIALAIRKKFPEAYQADRQTKYGDQSKLGTYSYWHFIAEGECRPTILNLYSQVGIGSKDRQTSYDAMDRGLRGIEKELAVRVRHGHESKLGMPYKIGCGLANGSWHIVESIIEDIFETSPVSAVIVRLS